MSAEDGAPGQAMANGRRRQPALTMLALACLVGAAVLVAIALRSASAAEPVLYVATDDRQSLSTTATTDPAGPPVPATSAAQPPVTTAVPEPASSGTAPPPPTSTADSSIVTSTIVTSTTIVPELDSTDAPRPTTTLPPTTLPTTLPPKRAPIGVTSSRATFGHLPVVPVGKEDDGKLEVPGADEIGWYKYGSSPGRPGATVLAAHVSWNGELGPFWELGRLEPGDTIDVTLEDGTLDQYEVTEVTMYPKDALPRDRIWTETGDEVLVLITCGGEFDDSINRYRHNIVVYARPIA